ncbi:class II D-tagatose-bisphosphate aldolase, non-catalytic subunit [Proteiniphilum sp.]|uniref:class II D-tagatose-bisphosphate aldolase non-catalytic subunit n=1 Tax=Proteiniphilum sp. TaxID=1926877 RepID=UPI003321B233
MAKTEKILSRIEELKSQTGVPRTLFAVCPNSLSVIKASFRAAKRNNAPIKFAATLNQIDSDKGYVGITQKEFTKLLADEARSVNFNGPYIVAIDHGGPWLKDKQSQEKWNLEKAMNGVKKSFEDAIEANYDLIHVDPTVDIFVPAGEIIDIRVVAQRTVELIKHSENFRRSHNYPPISYEVGTEEVHGGLADEDTFDTFIALLKNGLEKEGLSDVWPCFIVGKVGTDLHTTTFDKEVATTLTKKVRKFGSYIKGHYTDGVVNPGDYPLCGIGAANVGPEFTMSEYDALIELEQMEKGLYENDQIAVLSTMKQTLWNLVIGSNRWKKWLQPDEMDIPFENISTGRKEWLIKTGCRYIWQHPEALVARYRLYENLNRNGIDAEEVVLSRIERDMDKYFYAFNLVNLNDYLS